MQASGRQRGEQEGAGDGPVEAIGTEVQGVAGQRETHARGGDRVQEVKMVRWWRANGGDMEAEEECR